MLNLQQFHANKIAQDVSLILKDEKLTLIDIGAAGGIEPRWQPIVKQLHYVGFEPDARSDTKSDNGAAIFLSETIYPTALWNASGEITVHLCEKPEVSSCYQPNMAFLQRFSNAKRFDVNQTIVMEAKTLDSLGVSSADFIKIDIQGAELDALQGGVNTLRQVFGVEAEVEFSPLYVGQPLFGELSEFLTNQGFEFIDFTNLCRWDRKERNTYGQCVFGDALFLKSPEFVMDLFSQRIIKLGDVRRYIAILLLYRRLDLIVRCKELLNVENAETECLKEEILVVCKKLSKKLKMLKYIRKIAAVFLRLFVGQTRLHQLY